MRRRDFLGSMGIAAPLALSGTALGAQTNTEAPVKRNGRIRQGITRGVFGNGQSPPTIEYCCREAARLGIKGCDFFDNPDDWPTLKKYGLVLSMMRLEFGGGLSGPGRAPNGPPAPSGWNAIGTKDEGGQFQAAVHAGIDTAAANGFPNMLLQTGAHNVLSYDQGADNAVAFCSNVKAHAEDKGVTLCMEIVNSKGQGGPKPEVGYMFDHMAWGVDVMKRINSPRVKILCDIFHVQLMDGNITQNIIDAFPYIGHFHTGGVPGRHEIDETQEINYRFIVQKIVDMGYTGFITHEWTPTPGRDPIASLDKVIGIIDV